MPANRYQELTDRELSLISDSFEESIPWASLRFLPEIKGRDLHELSWTGLALWFSVLLLILGLMTGLMVWSFAKDYGLRISDHLS